MTESTLPQRSLVLTNAPNLHWHTEREEGKALCDTNSQKTKNPTVTGRNCLASLAENRVGLWRKASGSGRRSGGYGKQKPTDTNL